MTRFVFVTGGVVSSLGKGIASASLGAILEGGYDVPSLALSVRETLAALGDGQPARSNAPEPLLTSRAASYVGRHWPL